MQNHELSIATARTSLRSSILDPRSSIQMAWLARGAMAFIFTGLLLAYIQFAGPNIVDYDGYYHIKMAQLIREQGLPVKFPWLKFTVIDEPHYTDPHMLMHVFQIPFTLIGDLRLAAKWSSIAFATCAFMIFYWVLWRYGIRYPLLWLVVLFASSPAFLYRMSMPRGQSLSLASQFIAFHLIMTRNAVGLAILSAIFVWTYNGFPVLIPIVLFGVFAHYLAERRMEYKLIIGLGVGIIAGFLVNPYFPRNVLFIWNHIAPKLLATKYETSVGSEWYPYDSWVFLTLSLVAILAYVSALLITNREGWRQDTPRLFWFLVSTLDLALLLKSRRFVEYFPPTAVMFLAFSVRGWLKDVSLTRWFQTKRRVAGVIVAGVLLLLAFLSSVRTVRKDIAEEEPTDAYKGGAQWLAHHTPPGSTVFHTDWDDFPMLFFYNTHNTYIVGLDPDFMRLKDEPLFRRWEAITLGNVDHPEEAILNEFGCQYVFTDNEHEDFMAIADQSPRLERVYSDRFTTVYHVLPKARAQK